MTMKTKIFSLILFSSFIATENFSFLILNDGQSMQITNLKASAKANKVIRNNAYLSFGDLGFKSSDCWKEFIKNKKITIKASDSYYKLIKRTNSFYEFSVYIDPKKITIKDIAKEEFVKYCSIR